MDEWKRREREQCYFEKLQKLLSTFGKQLNELDRFDTIGRRKLQQQAKSQDFGYSPSQIYFGKDIVATSLYSERLTEAVNSNLTRYNIMIKESVGGGYRLNY